MTYASILLTATSKLSLPVGFLIFALFFVAFSIIAVKIATKNVKKIGGWERVPIFKRKIARKIGIGFLITCNTFTVGCALYLLFATLQHEGII